MGAEEALDRMAEEALENVRDGFIIGLGSGVAVSKFAVALGKYVKERGLRVLMIPSSLQIRLFAEASGLEVAPPHLIPSIDLHVDGADQIDGNFNLIKGGGGALLRERVLLRAAKKTVILADEGKFVNVLNRAVPIEALPFARTFVMKEVERVGGKGKLRTNVKGYPIFTENGNILIDADFGPIHDPPSLLVKVKDIPGVIEVGIFTEKVHRAYRARSDGSVEKLSPSR